MDHKRRLKRLQEVLPAQKLDVLVISHLANIRYLCGFTGSAGLLLVTEKKAVFFTDGRYTAQAKEEVQGASVVVGSKPPLSLVGEWLAKNRQRMGRRIGIEGEDLTVGERTRLNALLPSGFQLKQAPPLIERARMIKDPDEIESLRAAVLLGASLFDVARTAIRPGVRETEVAAEMEYEARRRGADQMSFDTIIASGERSALPHGRASEAAIAREGFVVCDFGVILTGYCSDMTRTVYVGRPPDEARRLYSAVKASQQAALETVRAGVSAGEVDRAARKVLEKQGLAKAFVHSTGHGVGLEIHEAPRIAARQEEILHPGMVITIEPGAYIAGKWGVRIEDMVVVTEDGCEILTPTSKELICV